MMLPVLIGWIIGVPLDIWWPRRVAPEHAGLARAYALIRVVSVLLTLSYVPFIVVLFLLGGFGPVGWLEALGIGFGGEAFMLSPLATCATALDAQRRWMAVFACYGAALLTAGQAWMSLSIFLSFLPPFPQPPFLYVASVAASAILAAVAFLLVLELYAMVRRPSE